MSSHSFDELEAAAKAVIGILKTIPEFSNARIAVIGGLSLWKYIRTYRTTQDVDFLITIQGAPKAVKDRLLAIPSGPFQQQAQIFLYEDPNGRRIQIDITPDWQSPYLPTAVAVISTIQPGSLPYIPELDLLVFKIHSCGLRATVAKKRGDAGDARALIDDLISKKSNIVLSPAQKNAVSEGLDDVVKFSGMDKTWWKAKLNLG